MFWLNWIIFLLFFPSSLGLLWQTFITHNLSHQLIFFAFFLFSLEQSRMAVVDLKSCYLGKKNPNNYNLSHFFVVIIMTIIIELIGFYVVLFSLGWGAILVLISQIWFNLFAQVKISEGENTSIKNYTLQDKIIILLADFIALFLMILWKNNFYPLTIAICIFIITLTFTIIKYSPFLISKIKILFSDLKNINN